MESAHRKALHLRTPSNIPVQNMEGSSFAKFCKYLIQLLPSSKGPARTKISSDFLLRFFHARIRSSTPFWDETYPDIKAPFCPSLGGIFDGIFLTAQKFLQEVPSPPIP